MSVSDSQPIPMWHRGAPGDPAVIDALARRFPALPMEYLAFMRAEDGSQGDLAVEPGWIQLWPAADVEQLNDGYEIASFLPGFLGFGSNGGGELFAFDMRVTPWRVCMVPFLPMEEAEAVEIAVDFTTLARGFGVGTRDE